MEVWRKLEWVEEGLGRLNRAEEGWRSQGGLRRAGESQGELRRAMEGQRGMGKLKRVG